MPSPGGFDDAAQIRLLRLPTQHSFSFFVVGHQARGIARAAILHECFYFFAGDFARRLNHFQDAVAAAGAEIQKIGWASLPQMLQRAVMGVGQIGDVNVIADGGSVGRRIGTAKYGNLRALAGSGGQDIGNEVRFRLVLLAAIFRGACGVKIAKPDEFQTVSVVVSFEDTLKNHLGPAVGIGWRLRS